MAACSRVVGYGERAELLEARPGLLQGESARGVEQGVGVLGVLVHRGTPQGVEERLHQRRARERRCSAATCEVDLLAFLPRRLALRGGGAIVDGALRLLGEHLGGGGDEAALAGAEGLGEETPRRPPPRRAARAARAPPRARGDRPRFALARYAARRGPTIAARPITSTMARAPMPPGGQGCRRRRRHRWRRVTSHAARSLSRKSAPASALAAAQRSSETRRRMGSGAPGGGGSVASSASALRAEEGSETRFDRGEQRRRSPRRRGR